MNQVAVESELAVQGESVRAALQAATSAIGQVIVGQQTIVEDVLAALVADGHVLLEGVPGLGKTLLVRTLGQVSGLHFGRIQLTPDLMPADITGTQIFDRETGRLEFSPGPIFTNLLLADEVNRATPRTQSALLEAMQERTVTTAGETRLLPRPFLVLATQNPIEMEGTYPLPEAQLDRFLFKLLVPFPTEDELTSIAERTTVAGASVVPLVLSAELLLEAQQLARTVVIAPHVLRHAVRIVSATHPDRSPSQDIKRYVRHGSSPRGLQALVLGAKARALRDGRWNVAFTDLERMAAPSLRHRLILRFEASAEGVAADALIAQILRDVRHEG
ncbi:MAG: AAA family ATPase [Gemmatimonadota bacterium]